MRNWLYSVFKQHENRIAVRDTEGVITYQELLELSLKVKSVLPNDHKPVGLYLEKSIDYIIALCAVFFSKDYFVPLHPSLPEERILYIIQNSKMETILTTDKYDHTRLVSSDSSLKRVYNTSVKQAVQYTPIQNYQIEKDNEEDIAYSIYTSGSTGKPKGIVIPFRGLDNVIQQQIQTFGYTKETISYWFSSIMFDASLSDLFCCLGSGGTLVINEQVTKSVSSFIKYINNHKVNLLDIPPSYLCNLKPTDIPTVKTILVGGELANETVVKNFSKHVSVFNIYGPTETSICSSFIQVDENWKSENIGKPIDNVKYRIQDDELWISGICLGKYIDENLQKEKFIVQDGVTYYKTGDIVFTDKSNYFFKGRKDNQIKHNGILIHCEEIEKVLLNHSDIQNVKVSYMEKKIYCYYKGNASNEELRKHLSKYLPKSFIPHQFYQVNSGKHINHKFHCSFPTVQDLLQREEKIEYKRPGHCLQEVFLFLGATGFLGAFSLNKLSQNPNVKKVYCLVRGTNPKERLQKVFRQYNFTFSNKINVFVGDSSQKNLGLSDVLYKQLANEVDSVVCASGEVNNLKPYYQVKLSNVETVKNCIYFSQIEKLKHIHLASSLSVFVSTRPEMCIAESAIKPSGSIVPTGYAQSKIVAESVCNTGIKIYRFGFLLESFPEFYTSKKNFLHILIQKLIKNKVCPSMDQDYSIDITPINFAADMFIHQILNLNNQDIFHITCKQKLYLSQIVDKLQIKQIPLPDFLEQCKDNLLKSFFVCKTNLSKAKFDIFEGTTLTYQEQTIAVPSNFSYNLTNLLEHYT